MIVEVPATRPFTSPMDEIVATAGLLLTHDPPGVASNNEAVKPAHILSVPVIGAVVGFTVSVVVAVQPVGMVYVMVVVPDVLPVTSPPASIVATGGLLLAHVPPVSTSLSDDVAPIHTFRLPAIACGDGLIVSTVVVRQPVPSV